MSGVGVPALEFFLTPSEKDHVAKWKEVVHDRSFINPLLNPVFDRLASFVPATIAPNVLTLTGSFAILQAWLLCREHSALHSSMISLISMVSVLVFWLLGGIDGKHARRTMNDTSLGELFKYCCDLTTSVFLAVLLCLLLLGSDLDTQWYCVQIVQAVLLLKHYSAFQRNAGLRYLFIGPGELVSWAAGLLVLKAVIGVEWMNVCYTYTRGLNLSLASMAPARIVYLGVWIFMFRKIVLSEKHTKTRNSLISVLMLRAVSGLISLSVLSPEATSERDVLLDGLFMAMVTSDVIVAKMAGRELHSLLLIMACMVVLPHLQCLILCFVVFYYVSVLGDLMHHMNLPLLQVCRNVYCDGVYDLCHVGHKNMFRNALSHGNRLFVGVVGDEDASNYKRPPVMTAAEREAEVANCKCVTKVIANAPCFGLTEEFIKKHRVHVVAFGQEYADRFPNPDDDPYYKVPRKMGIARAIPRTEEISTDELIQRIQTRDRSPKKSPT